MMPANIKEKYICYLLLSVLVFLSSACEDQPLLEYDPEPVLEGYLIVDQPIRNIVIAQSQPITQKYDYTSMMDASAEVIIQSGDFHYRLRYDGSNGGSYSYPDTTVLVKPETKYEILVRTSKGEVMTAHTTTPKRFSWVDRPKELIQYPQDTTQLFSPDSLLLSWTSASVPEYLVRVTVLDTLGYGIYLLPSTNEINERTNNLPFEDARNPEFYSLHRWGMIQTTTVPTVWAAFRWYGRNEVAVLAPDKALIDWFKAIQWGGRSVEYKAEFSNVSGGVGVFGSVSIVSQEVFVLKRKK